ncbi:MAG: hypothetical protein M0041_03905 [Nitrospiraceae bacterium]|nr:hypothetical protein [Nitrospiraceae bacterium]
MPGSGRSENGLRDVGIRIDSGQRLTFTVAELVAAPPLDFG